MHVQASVSRHVMHMGDLLQTVCIVLALVTDMRSQLGMHKDVKHTHTHTHTHTHST